MEWRVVPMVNENDTTATDEITFGDNDFLSAQVAILLAPGCWSCSPTPPGCTPPTRRDAARSWSARSTTSPP